MNKDKIEELIAASKLNELLRKKEAEEDKKKSNVIIIVLAVIGAVAALAAIVYAIYRYFTPDYLDDLMTTSMMMTLKTILKMKKMTSRTN